MMCLNKYFQQQQQQQQQQQHTHIRIPTRIPTYIPTYTYTVLNPTTWDPHTTTCVFDALAN